MIKNITKGILFILLSVNFQSCLDVVDFDPTDRYTIDVAFSSEENVQLYLNSFYAMIYESGQYGDKSLGNNTSMSDALTDVLKYGGIVAGTGDPNLIMTVDNYVNTGANPFNSWTGNYTWIRKINEFLAALDRYRASFPDKAGEFEAEARFFRAYAYFLIMRNHASKTDDFGVIIYDNITEMTTGKKNKARSSVSDSWDFIESDLNFCITDGYLPKKRYAGGRLTYYAAQALRARAMLYAKRYDAAKEAALAIQANPEFGYTDDYSTIFESVNNSEVVFGVEYKINELTHSFDYEFAPAGDIVGKGGTAGPTQEFVDMYDLADGTPFDLTNPAHSAIRFVTGENVTQRDPRLQATVLYNGAAWKGRTIECYYNAGNGSYSIDMLRFPYGRYNSPGNTVTGYYMRKLLDESNTDFVTYSSYQPWNEFRYAETMLILAECYAHEEKYSEAHDILLDLRKKRFGSETVKTPALTNRDQALDVILKERCIELAFEGQRFWDLRRTGKARTTLNGKSYHGVLWTLSGGTITPSLVSCEMGQRLYPARFDAFPIPENEISNNTLAKQNYNW